MVGDTAQNQMDKELVAWIETIPFSKPARNLTRDFSDAVLVAEILKLYYPRYVELHNYVPVNNLNMKKENWNTLNRKVLTKIEMKLNKDTIHHLANASQSAIERFLLDLRLKILRDEEGTHKSKIKDNVDVDVQMSKEKIGDNNASSNDDRFNRFNSTIEDSSKLETDNEINKINPSRFACFKRGFFVVFYWITCIFRIWNIFSYCKFLRSGEHSQNANAAPDEQIENVNDFVERAIYTKLKQELREKEEIISTLNHKIAYLESSMKLKDLRISSLMTQILQNTVEIDQSTKLQSNDGNRVKLRSRSHNFHENKTN